MTNHIIQYELSFEENEFKPEAESDHFKVMFYIKVAHQVHLE
ncbi:hypothetical protein T11_2191 [Trichinella zimbabwensis]|uniref:Uncharacterized protein n=1 Tax=Trichinella zimbabwensis TaxID=268475 RepID=A0A0V1GGW4_9BILA|nr:hypothetical protein T11_2191 [Trichinella zimbabwensis]